MLGQLFCREGQSEWRTILVLVTSMTYVNHTYQEQVDPCPKCDTTLSSLTFQVVVYSHELCSAIHFSYYCNNADGSLMDWITSLEQFEKCLCMFHGLISSEKNEQPN